jgi:hypothetical protein
LAKPPIESCRTANPRLLSSIIGDDKPGGGQGKHGVVFWQQSDENKDEFSFFPRMQQ